MAWPYHLCFPCANHIPSNLTTTSGLGLAFTRYLLQNTNLQVVATTSRDSSSARDAILKGKDDKVDEKKLLTLDMDITNEAAIRKAAKMVEEKYGKGNLRLLINVAGVVRAMR